MHARTKIRKAIENSLLAGRIKSIGTRIYFNRSKALTLDDLPAIRGYIRKEEIDYLSIVELPELHRKCEMIIEVCVADSNTIDDDLEGICESVEKILDAGQVLGGAKYIKLQDVVIGLKTERENVIGIAQYVYEVSYVTAAQAPDVTL